MEMKLSKYGQASARPSPVNRMMAEFAASFRVGVDINLGVGYVNENTIPQDRLSEAMGAIVAEPEKYQHIFNYGGFVVVNHR